MNISIIYFRRLAEDGADAGVDLVGLIAGLLELDFGVSAVVLELDFGVSAVVLELDFGVSVHSFSRLHSISIGFLWFQQRFCYTPRVGDVVALTGQAQVTTSPTMSVARTNLYTLSWNLGVEIAKGDLL